MFDFEQPLDLPDGSGRRDEGWASAWDERTASMSSRGPRSPRGELRARAGDESDSSSSAIEPALPPHLASYGRNRLGRRYSGPGLPAEDDEGSVEYKLRISAPTPSRFHSLASQLKYRLAEGGGTAHYCVGVEDNGHPVGLSQPDLESSLAALDALAAEVGADTALLRTPPGSGEGRRCAVVRVTARRGEPAGFLDLRVAAAGAVDSGKSTLVAVLTRGAGGAPALDDGRGSARGWVLAHKHELESGRSSSLGAAPPLGYDARGAPVNYSPALGCAGPADVALAASRLLRFVDLSGHERYSKTALRGLTGPLPDYCMLCVCAATGASRVTREHLAAALGLGLPVFCVLTKADLGPCHVAPRALAEVRALVAAAAGVGPGAGCEALAPLADSEAAAAALGAAMQRRHARRHRGAADAAGGGLALTVPLFLVSSVTGRGLPALHAFLSALPRPPPGGASAQGWRASASAARAAPSGGRARAAGPATAPPALPAVHFQVDRRYSVAGVGPVYGGTMLAGRLRAGDRLLAGPLPDGGFVRALVRGIQRSQVPVAALGEGQHGTVAVQLEGAEESEAQGRGAAGLWADAPGQEPPAAAAAAASGGGDGGLLADWSFAAALGSPPDAPPRAPPRPPHVRTAPLCRAAA